MSYQPPSCWRASCAPTLRGKSGVGLAHELLNQLGGLCALLCTDRMAFCSGKGLSETKFVQLQAVLEIARRDLFKSRATHQSALETRWTRAYLAVRLREYLMEWRCSRR